MDIFLFIFLGVSFGGVIGGFLIEGGSPGMLVGISPIVIVLGGTIGACGVSFPKEVLKDIPKVFKALIRGDKYNVEELIDTLKEMCVQVRRNGLLCLESQIEAEPDSIMRKGMRLLVDGANSDVTRESLELAVEMMSARHKERGAFFEAAAGFCPTMGIIGTVMGLVLVLSDMSDIDSLGHKISVAFIATLYGVGIANLLFMPLATRLKGKNHAEVMYKSVIIEGLLMIQEGAAVNALEERLVSFLSDKKLVERNL
ncbi:MAG: motility protein A [Eubacteriales bacterium]|nr:motility protein A [Eubacteriales bacterium]